MDKFYITTSIAYTNAPPHIGFALELVEADVLARLARLEGKDVRFSTGTDEHGQKQWETAKKQGIDAQKLADKNSAKFKKLTRVLDISNTDFIRTTDQEIHFPSARQLWKMIAKRGDLYKKQYEGLYCVGCERFMLQKELKDGKCPMHLTKPEKQREENYFFKLSHYAADIEDRIKSDELKILPISRKNEILEFIASGLEDVSFSRSKEKLPWGIPVPDDDLQVMYVWCDALSNYLSVLGFGERSEDFINFWPADIHLIGKDILRFHAVIWPAMLLSAGLPLPQSILTHGFITSDGEKMSKSRGNVIDPIKLVENFGADATRYYLLREIPSDADGDFSQARFLSRYRSDLANGLGNLVNRILVLIEKARLKPQPLKPKLSLQVKKHLNNFQLHRGLEEIFSWVGDANRLIDQYKPWEKIKSADPASRKNLEKFLYDLYARIEEINFNLSIFLPATSAEIQKQLQTLKPKILFEKK